MDPIHNQSVTSSGSARVKTCPYCAETIQDDAQVCPLCTTNLVAPGVALAGPSPVAPGEAQRSGKALASLICGIFFFLLPTAIVAVVMGHLSLGDIRRSMGRVRGRGMAISGLVLGYMGLSFLPVLIIAAIAIPNLLRSKMAANEALAVASMRNMSTACTTYSASYDSYPRSLADLSPNSKPSARGADLLTEQLASGQLSGYVFTYEGAPDENGVVVAYRIYGDPITPGATGSRHFFADQTGVIRVNKDGAADESSPPVQ